MLSGCSLTIGGSGTGRFNSLAKQQWRLGTGNEELPSGEILCIKSKNLQRCEELFERQKNKTT